jgi:hypothetical protein
VSRVAFNGSLSEVHTLYNQSLTREGELRARGAKGGEGGKRIERDAIRSRGEGMRGATKTLKEVSLS